MREIRGRVKKGEQRGKILGFPTANITIRTFFPQGIYLSRTKVAGIFYPSLTFIGEQAETYILDFSGDLYHRWIRVELIKKIRDSKKFKSDQALIEQIKKDELVARKFFNMVR
ncbi:riboflavin kinase [Candidatus Daviesbacteria bacterium]|nr:riboflavin kinase [Candidatus Daviesbacteria bacterium]